MLNTPQSRRTIARWAIFAAVHLVLGVVLTMLVAYARCVVANHAPFNNAVGQELSAHTNGPLFDAPGTEWHGYQWTWHTRSSLGMVHCTSFMFDPTWEERALVHRLGTTPVLLSLREVPPPHWAACEDPLKVSPGSPWSDFGPQHEDTAFGWPFLCIHQRYTIHVRHEHDVCQEDVHGARVEIPFFKSRFNHYGLWPTHILWPAMFGNVLVWALISTIPRFAWRGVKTLRSKSRTKQGRCPRCGYDRVSLSPASPCPECGVTQSSSPSRPKA